MTYKAPPEQSGLTPAQGDAIYVFYVEREMTMADARKAVEKQFDCALAERKISHFINANGWKRSQHHYARRSPWRGYNRAGIEASKAKRRKSGYL